MEEMSLSGMVACRLRDAHVFVPSPLFGCDKTKINNVGKCRSILLADLLDKVFLIGIIDKLDKTLQ